MITKTQKTFWKKEDMPVFPYDVLTYTDFVVVVFESIILVLQILDAVFHMTDNKTLCVSITYGK